MNLKNIKLSEKSQSQKTYIICNFIYMKCPELATPFHRDRKLISDCQGLRVRVGTEKDC